MVHPRFRGKTVGRVSHPLGMSAGSSQLRSQGAQPFGHMHPVRRVLDGSKFPVERHTFPHLNCWGNIAWICDDQQTALNALFLATINALLFQLVFQSFWHVVLIVLGEKLAGLKCPGIDECAFADHALSLAEKIGDETIE